MKQQLATSSFIVSKTQTELDLKMVGYDIWATEVHVLMLRKVGAINKNTAKKCLKALELISKEYKNGNFIIDTGRGAQLTLEAKIVEKAGDAGLSIHTGRSRNDQVMVTELLYLREEMLSLNLELMELVNVLLKLAQKSSKIVMPGYTHMQPGKVTTVGVWALSFANSFLRSSEILKNYLDLYDMNPLGSVESFGTSWPLDREFTTKLLGFGKVWDETLDAISSRGFAQLGYMNAMSQMAIVASKINQDLLLYNTFEYGIVELGEDVAQRMHPITGSSVMAQKKNPDALEIIRSTSSQLIGFSGIVANILHSLPSGYNRDAREIKEYIDLGTNKTRSVISTLCRVISSLKFNEKRMLELVNTNYSLTTDLADYVSQKSGVGYRIVYKIIGSLVDEAIRKNKQLADIKAEDIIKKGREIGVELKLTDEEIKKAIDPVLVIERRKHIGGSSSAAFSKSIKNTFDTLKKRESWIKEKQRIIKTSKVKTATAVSDIINN